MAIIQKAWRGLQSPPPYLMVLAPSLSNRRIERNKAWFGKQSPYYEAPTGELPVWWLPRWATYTNS